MFECSTTNFTKTNSSKTAALAESRKIFILTPNEIPSDDSIEIGYFEHLEDWNGSWDYLMKRIRKKARESGANIIKIDQYFEGSKTKGHGYLIRGKFYLSKNQDIEIEDYIQSVRVKNVSNCNCSYVKVFRDEGSAIVKTAFKMDLVVNDSLLGKLTNKTAYSVKLNQESEVFIGTSHSTNFLFENNFGKEYYVIATQNMTTSTPGTVMIGPKGFYLIESLKGKVQFETLENLTK